MAKKHIGYGDFFCTVCGDRIEKNAANCPRCGQPYDEAVRWQGTTPVGAGGVGWSQCAADPSFGRNKRKTVVGSLVFAVLVSVAICVGLTVSGELSPEENLPVYLGILGILWGFWLIWLFITYRSKKDWEGVVESKNAERKRYEEVDDDGSKTVQYKMFYTVLFRTLQGKQKKLTLVDRPSWYQYLTEGDRIRYHGKMDYYEKFDRSRDSIVPCASCGAERDARETYCGRCGAILLKGAPVAQTVPPAQAAPAQPTAAPSFCPNCGAPAGGQRFCSSCGSKLM